jgi:hypothetical protein
MARVNQHSSVPMPFTRHPIGCPSASEKHSTIGLSFLQPGQDQCSHKHNIENIAPSSCQRNELRPARLLHPIFLHRVQSDARKMLTIRHF